MRASSMFPLFVLPLFNFISPTAAADANGLTVKQASLPDRQCNADEQPYAFNYFKVDWSDVPAFSKTEGDWHLQIVMYLQDTAQPEAYLDAKFGVDDLDYATGTLDFVVDYNGGKHYVTRNGGYVELDKLPYKWGFLINNLQVPGGTHAALYEETRLSCHKA